MQNIKSYHSLFPIHDIEFEWLEKGIEQGIERGIEQGIEQGIERGIERGKTEGMLEQAQQTLATLDPETSRAMSQCRDVATVQTAIEVAIQRLRSGPTQP